VKLPDDRLSLQPVQLIILIGIEAQQNLNPVIRTGIRKGDDREASIRIVGSILEVEKGCGFSGISIGNSRRIIG
jgi:hypothetical protein